MPKPSPIDHLMKILRLPVNTVGRTFVCGDIHGSYSCVMRFLKEVNFNYDTDRFICAGDLIDRGPANEECLELLNRPWFYCVMGNHEQLMENFFNGGPYGGWWLQNGGSWGINYIKEQSTMASFIRMMQDKVKELPYLITVEKNDGGLFHVLHAELSHRSRDVTDEALADPNKFHQFATVMTNNGDSVIWGRDIFVSLFNHVLDEHTIKKFSRHAKYHHLGDMFNDKLSHIYSGHTIVQQPVRFMGQTNLDTCAYGSYQAQSRYSQGIPPSWCGLTVTEPETDKFWLINDREFKEVKPVIIEQLLQEKTLSIDSVEEHD